jgi:hypothetical protein
MNSHLFQVGNANLLMEQGPGTARTGGFRTEHPRTPVFGGGAEKHCERQRALLFPFWLQPVPHRLWKLAREFKAWT